MRGPLSFQKISRKTAIQCSLVIAFFLMLALGIGFFGLGILFLPLLALFVLIEAVQSEMRAFAIIVYLVVVVAIFFFSSKKRRSLFIGISTACLLIIFLVPTHLQRYANKIPIPGNSTKEITTWYVFGNDQPSISITATIPLPQEDVLVFYQRELQSLGWGLSREENNPNFYSHETELRCSDKVIPDEEYSHYDVQDLLEKKKCSCFSKSGMEWAYSAWDFCTESHNRRGISFVGDYRKMGFSSIYVGITSIDATHTKARIEVY